ncbi:MAG TPA: ABC transporter substrate-binding protein [Candidatus Binatia bacterium]|jgi:NitT/TauT family transport system substrate-binding protein
MRKAAAASSLVFFLASAASALALDKLVMGYTGIGVGAEIHQLAKDAGLFKKHGLDVEIIYIPAGSTAVQAMVSDQISVGWGNDAAGVVASYAAGVTLKLTAVLANKFVYSFVTPAGIARPQDLKGKSVAVSRFGSGSDFITRMALKSWGLDAKDVTILQIGNSPARLGALAAGRVHGSILSLSQTPRAKKMGLRVLADLSQIDVEYPQGVVYTTPAFIAKKPDQMLRFTRAYVEAVSLFKTNRQAALPVIEKYTGLADKEEAAEYYDTFVKHFLQDFPLPSTAALRTLLEDVARASPKAKDLKPQDLVDLRFLNEIKGR